MHDVKAACASFRFLAGRVAGWVDCFGVWLVGWLVGLIDLVGWLVG